ncbi:DEAD/DEAH box RNA helicase [Achlya hypogyna]|uniref:RNA helicase n=1 Tax=Achlya hypogyna TaxID=1202772 RepID=A0A1V9Z8Q4_ACHHY|nr:DEAD/DEAH box RNA helicase [Achlya hypogyna]
MDAKKTRELDAREAMAKVRASLPIFQWKKSILDTVRNSRVVIVVGETGSGKTTQIPQYIFESKMTAPTKRIAVTQPRRVAAITVAQRVAEEMGSVIGTGPVGYCVRFDDTTTPNTKLKFMTDGMLVREALLSPSLDAYSVIVLDEAHERSLQTDILFGVVKRALAVRKDLRVVVMSATLDVGLFESFFKESAPAVLRIPGRMHPVEIFYTAKALPDYLDAVLVTTLQIHLDNPDNNGSVLVFLTGQDDIETMEGLLTDYGTRLPATAAKLLVCPIFSAMPREAQMLAFEPAPRGVRKVILATNIAETSITINGVRFVVDAGLVKQRSFVGHMEHLQVESISQAQAWQRSGRAGREAPGVCYRLFPEEKFEELEPRAVPEIKRVSLEVVVLQLKVMGIDDIIGFDFIERPNTNNLLKALEKLYALGAFNTDGSLTPRGRTMASLPVDPMCAVMLLKALELGCAADALSVVAMLSVESIFYSPREQKEKAASSRAQFVSVDGDQIMLLNVFNAYNQTASKQRGKWCRDHFINHRAMQRVEKVREQLTGYLSKVAETDAVVTASALPDTVPVRKAIVAGFFLNAAMRTKSALMSKASFQTMCNAVKEDVKVHPSSVLFMRNPPPRYVVFNELVFTSKHYIRNLVPIEKDWLVEAAPQFFKKVDQMHQ